MKKGPPLPPGAPPEVEPVLGAVTGLFRGMQELGRDFAPMLCVADDPSVSPTLIANFGETPDERADQLFAVVASWPYRGAQRVLWAVDTWMRKFDPEEDVVPTPEGYEGPKPSEDPKSLEALMMVYVERPEGSDMPRIALGAFPYGLDDNGRFHWLEGGEWMDEQVPRDRQVMAVFGATISDEQLLAAVQKMEDERRDDEQGG